MNKNISSENDIHGIFIIEKIAKILKILDLKSKILILPFLNYKMYIRFISVKNISY